MVTTERWEGMPPGDAEPGKVWFHAVETIEDWHGRRPAGWMFQAPADAPEAELRRLAALSRPERKR